MSKGKTTLGRSCLFLKRYKKYKHVFKCVIESNITDEKLLRQLFNLFSSENMIIK